MSSVASMKCFDLMGFWRSACRRRTAGSPRCSQREVRLTSPAWCCRLTHVVPTEGQSRSTLALAPDHPAIHCAGDGAAPGLFVFRSGGAFGRTEGHQLRHRQHGPAQIRDRPGAERFPSLEQGDIKTRLPREFVGNLCETEPNPLFQGGTLLAAIEPVRNAAFGVDGAGQALVGAETYPISQRSPSTCST
jgi:hypothetical protein